MKIRSLLTALSIPLCVFLSACGDSAPPPPAVGSVLPGGLTVRDSGEFKDFALCVEHAKKIQSALRVKKVIEDNTGVLYYGQVMLTEGGSVLHICNKVSGSVTHFVSASE